MSWLPCSFPESWSALVRMIVLLHKAHTQGGWGKSGLALESPFKIYVALQKWWHLERFNSFFHLRRAHVHRQCHHQTAWWPPLYWCNIQQTSQSRAHRMQRTCLLWKFASPCTRVIVLDGEVAAWWPWTGGDNIAIYYHTYIILPLQTTWSKEFPPDHAKFPQTLEPTTQSQGHNTALKQLAPPAGKHLNTFGLKCLKEQIWIDLKVFDNVFENLLPVLPSHTPAQRVAAPDQNCRADPKKTTNVHGTSWYEVFRWHEPDPSNPFKPGMTNTSGKEPDLTLRCSNFIQILCSRTADDEVPTFFLWSTALAPTLRPSHCATVPRSETEMKWVECRSCRSSLQLRVIRFGFSLILFDFNNYE